MTTTPTGPQRPGRRRRRPARGPARPVDLLWAAVLRRFRDHVHETRPHPEPEDRR
jgi:hypothetical protein